MVLWLKNRWLEVACGAEEAQDSLEAGGMVAAHDDVVVADAALQEVVQWLLEAQVQLGAAHVGVGGALQQARAADEVVLHAPAAALDDGHVHGVKNALDGDTAQRLVVVAHDVAVGHRGSDGAVGKHHLVGGVAQYLGRIGHEGHLARGGLLQRGSIKK